MSSSVLTGREVSARGLLALGHVPLDRPMGVWLRLLLAALALLVVHPGAATAAVAQGWRLATSSTRSMVVIELPCEYEMPSRVRTADSRTMAGVDASEHRSEHLAAGFAQLQATRGLAKLA